MTTGMRLLLGYENRRLFIPIDCDPDQLANSDSLEELQIPEKPFHRVAFTMKQLRKAESLGFNFGEGFERLFVTQVPLKAETVVPIRSKKSSSLKTPKVPLKIPLYIVPKPGKYSVRVGDFMFCESFIESLWGFLETLRKYAER